VRPAGEPNAQGASRDPVATTRANAERLAWTAVSGDGIELVAAAATTAPAGIDENEDNDENSEGNEACADPQRLA
jgi:hypothetical protein